LLSTRTKAYQNPYANTNPYTKANINPYAKANINKDANFDTYLYT